MRRIMAVLIALLAALSLNSCIERPYEPVSPEIPAYNSKTIGGITLQWHINGTNLECVLISPYSGWVALAFNAGSTLHASGGNLIIGYVDGNGAHVSDENMSVLPHDPDTQQDVSGISGTQTASGTELHFTIPLNSGDASDMILTEGQLYNIFMAASSSDDITAYHDERGMGQINL